MKGRQSGERVVGVEAKRDGGKDMGREKSEARYMRKEIKKGKKEGRIQERQKMGDSVGKGEQS